MSDFRPHPRWPDGITELEQVAIADEVDITLAGFPSHKKELAVAITAYAENLNGFLVEDIRRGFALARQRAGEFAPSAGTVTECVAEARRGRVMREKTRVEETPYVPPAPDELPLEWHELKSKLRRDIEGAGDVAGTAAS